MVAEPPDPSRAPTASPKAVSVASASALPAASSRAETPKSGASHPPSEGQPGCRFQRLLVWTAGSVEWLGGCENGFAEGSGVIVNSVEDAGVERYYGRLDHGSPSIGVLQTDNGFVAGRWSHGKVLADPPDDTARRNVLIDAFRAAAEASSSVSKSFAKRSDTEASSFYATQARLLRDQMD